MPALTPRQRQRIGTHHDFVGIIESLAKDYHVSRATIRRWRAEGRKAHPVWTDQPGRGRKPVLSSAEKQSAKRKALKRRSVAQITSSLNAKRTKKVSSSTVKRSLKAGRDPLCYQPVTHGRHLSDTNKKKRAKWAKQQLNAHTATWVYLDSKYLYIYEDARGYIHWCWQNTKKKVTFKVKSNPTVMHFYAAIGKGFKSKLHFVPPTPPLGSKQRRAKVNFASKHFIPVIKKIHKEVHSSGKPGSRFRYIMDHARQHTSKASKAAMRKAGVQLVEGFPSQSWDINVIENAWGVMDTLLQGSRASTPSGWRRAALVAWRGVQQSTIDKLVGSVKQRVHDVAAKEGEWLKKKK
jgi:transposase